MRIYLKITPSEKIVPFRHLPVLTGTLHKWLGKANGQHEALSLYSFSWLKGGTKVASGLKFEGGATWFISCFDDGMMLKIIKGIQEDPMIQFELSVQEINIQETPSFSKEQLFRVASPVFIKRYNPENREEKHILYSDPAADQHLTETFQRKLRLAKINDKGASVAFDRNWQGAKTQLVYYYHVGNKANFCPVIVRGTPEQVAFAWLVGVGNSTGIGFGSLI